ncbi:MAG: hypothetical protein MI919_14835 [Holophagales bacterium]|nr:hypothetical protein [Holophagales bacterium]
MPALPLRDPSSPPSRCFDTRGALRRLSGLALVAVLLLAAAPGPVEGAPAGDPLLGGVVRMLQAVMSEEVIRQWVEASAERPTLPSADGMVQLREAGASDELLSFLIARARPTVSDSAGSAAPSTPPNPTPAPAPSAAGARMQPAAETKGVPEAAQPSADPRTPGIRVAMPAGGEGEGWVPTDFALSYSPYFLEGEKTWDLFLYLDGKPLSVVPEGGLFDSDTLRFSKQLEPGEHRLRLVQERHVEGRRGRLEHESRTGELELAFRLEQGLPAEVELSFSQSVLSSKNPVDFRIAQGGRVIDARQDVGGQPDRWSLVCEDLDVTLAGREPSRSQKRRYQDCVSWASLWPGGAPPRAEVIEALSRFDYRPVPKNEKLH